MDLEQLSRVFRVRKSLLRVTKEISKFVQETNGAWIFSQTATEECCVQILHIKARLLVALVLDICKSKTQELCPLEPRTEG